METVWTLLTHLIFLHLAKGSVTNVARNKPASMSSTYYGLFNASTAVDGNTTAVYPGGIIHTAINKDFAWWKVDLERDIQDATVEIYFRTDYKSYRNGVRIYVSTTPFSSYPEGQLCYTVTGDPSGSDINDVVSVTCPGRWRYLLVYTKTDNNGQGPVLDFGEVMVLACSDGTYGENCTKTCNARHCVTMTTTCERDGRCPGGCQSGWTGVDCTTLPPCQSGLYGLNCNKQCSERHCKESSTSSCDRLTGACPDGCKPGWRDIDCTLVCDSNFYGSGCSSLCSNRECLNSASSCDHVTGMCVGGCQSGYNGTDCVLICDSNFYGSGCSLLCSNRKCLNSASSCDHVTGLCVGGCQSGYTGTDCVQTCPSGSYGPGCNKTCGHCIGDNICNHVTGNCPGDCQDGWEGRQCQQGPLRYKYGYEVTYVCMQER